eukprot:CAMPEP_0178847116 /NCGR_PEP_ID=MMETSP0746-20121128/18476_1 /TAXON_ID=913974 /ORGANISM="Nitzschia punctata, Strain CCMP561" /LENGTH=90 /DNA_ID=CAMNT_0020511711 /DNA_START=130 /DNA_END=399 /DNA_ORIENTATION=-
MDGIVVRGDGTPITAPRPPINVASICFKVGIHSANFLRYSKSEASGLYSKYSVSSSGNCPFPDASRNGTTASKSFISFPDNHNSSMAGKF